jgi:hypothetical protein
LEYLKKEDYTHIKDTIDEFLGDTVMGNHLYKAIKVYFKRKNREIPKPRKIKEGIFEKNTVYPNAAKVENILKEANEALLKHERKLRRNNVPTKSKKKANN